MTPKLTYRDNYFYLRGSDILTINRMNWSKENEDWIKTKSIQAAAQFKSYADERATKIFKNQKPKLYEVSERLALPPYLDPHQIEGIKWILSRRCSYLAHAPGAGKTAQALIASIIETKLGNNLIIVPPSLIENWVREIEKFIPCYVTIGTVGGGAKEHRVVWNADYLIVSDAMLTKDWVKTRIENHFWKYIIVDEASRFKELNTKRSKTLYGIIRNTQHVVFLDGSPLPNRAMELYAPLSNLAPECIDYMTQEEFGHAYCGATFNDYGWEFKHFSNENELRKRMQRHFMHVVTEDKLNHPERLRSLVFINNNVLDKSVKTWEQKNLGSIKLSDLTDSDSKGELAEIRRKVGDSKIKPAVDYIKQRLQSGESILVFAWHREVCEQLSEKLDLPVVMGGTHASYREAIFKSFNAGGNKGIIGNIAAMARGHNLQKADRIIFVEYSWSNEVNTQAEKRASRRGRDQSLPVRCEYLVVKDSVDEVMLNSVMNKDKGVKRLIC